VSGPSGVVRDRRVIAVLAIVVLVVLALDVASALVPGMDGFLAKVPVAVIVLVAGTGLVLWLALGRGRRGDGAS
jgi:hypothetical protein